MFGYIMIIVEIVKILIFENNCQIWFKVQDLMLMKYIFYKGFIGIDGISLMVGEVMVICFCVYFILEMLQWIILGVKKLGDCVNIEIDLQIQVVVDMVECVLVVKEMVVKVNEV